jgi:rhodanese-related sulfurtransferase
MTRGPTSIGNVTAEQAFELITNEPASVLVDVRTQAEWSFVGIPDLSDAGKEPVLLEWQRYPAMSVDPAFAATLSTALEERGTGKDDAILFLCRSGARSLAAARALASLGFNRCLNISGGFEGPPDSSRQRGHLDGWKAKGLPWVQS